jgi:surface antigen
VRIVICFLFLSGVALGQQPLSLTCDFPPIPGACTNSPHPAPQACSTPVVQYPSGTGQWVCSNGNSQGSGCACAGSDNIGNNYYECVEFVKAYYKNVLGFDTSDWHGDADTYLSSPKKGTITFSNPGSTPPAPNDILVFTGPGHGHVAIVQSVSATSVTVIEQNWNATGVATLPMTVSNNTYSMPERSGYTIIGWARLASSTSPTNQAPLIGNLVTTPTPTMVGNFSIITNNDANIDPSSVFLYMTGPIGASKPQCTASSGQYTCEVANGYLSPPATTTAVTAPVNIFNQGYYDVYLQNGSTGAPSQPWQLEVQAPVPSITGLIPSSLPEYSTGQTISINGTGFTPSAAVTFNNQPHTTTSVSPSQITMVTALADVSAAGSFPIVVTNLPPGGGSSAGSSLTITTATPTMSVTPSSLSFGNQKVGTSATNLPVMVQNAGSGSLAVPSASISGTNASDFTVSNSCTNTLSTGQSCQMQVGFTPGSTGSRSATLTILSSGASGSPQTVALSGQGISAGVQITATVSPTNPTVGVTNVTITGTASPNATVMVSEKRPDNSTSTPAPEMANSAGVFVDGPFIPQLAGQYSETFSDTSGDIPTTVTFTAVSLPAPTIKSINPPVPTHSSANQLVTITGTGLVSGLSVLVTYPGGSSTLTPPLQAKWVSSTEVDCQSELNGTGQWTFQIKSPDGQVSNVFQFNVQ